MSELERLVEEIEERLKYEEQLGSWINASMTREVFINKLSSKYSVTLRNSDSSADNNKVEQSTTDEELMSKIKDLIEEMDEDQNLYDEDIKLCSNKLLKLFKTYQNSVLRQDLNQVSKYSNRSEIGSKIAFKNSLRHHVGKLVTADQELDQIVENIVNFFVDTVNPVFRALNDSDEQSIIK